MKNQMTSIVATVMAALSILTVAAMAQTSADAPKGQPEATINLAAPEGVKLVKGEWRYSDAKIFEIDFKGPGPDNQPTGAPRAGFVSIGIALKSRSRSASIIMIRPAQRSYSRRRSMITPKFGLMANFRARSGKWAVR
jgi:hypothetical protein